MTISPHQQNTRDPFGRLPEIRKPDPEIDNISKLFRLSDSVGDTSPNNRRDVAKVETIMGQAGYLNLKQTDGPTGYYGQRLKQAIMNFQKDNGLKKDGLINQRGETMHKLVQKEQLKPNASEKPGKYPPLEIEIRPESSRPRSNSHENRAIRIINRRLQNLGISNLDELKHLTLDDRQHLLEMINSYDDEGWLGRGFQYVSEWLNKNNKNGPLIINTPMPDATR